MRGARRLGRSRGPQIPRGEASVATLGETFINMAQIPRRPGPLGAMLAKTIVDIRVPDL